MNELPVLIYVAHPYGGRLGNLQSTKEIVRRLNGWQITLDPRAVFWAPWTDVCLTRDHSPESEKEGLDFDVSAVKMSHGLLLTGKEREVAHSKGMAIEKDAALSVSIPVMPLYFSSVYEILSDGTYESLMLFLDRVRESREKMAT